MAREERMRLLQKLEIQRNSRILVYITGDRRGLETKLATDVFPFILNHLSRMGHKPSIDLIIYSTGGITMAGYALVNLIREFCDRFGVIVPFKAHSAATLIALGADEVLMTKMGQLSPIDPSVESALGPQFQIPGQPGAMATVPVSVEDVVNYLNLARIELKLTDEDSLTRVFEKLTSSVHPLVLGGVQRVREQTAFLAKTLLAYHLKDESKISNMVEILTKGRYSHDYLIGRREARQVLGLQINEDEAIMSTVGDLYDEYDKLLLLSTPYNAEAELGSNDLATCSYNRAIIESDGMTHVFRTTKEIRRVTLSPPQVPVPAVVPVERILDEKWLRDDAI
jgi:hypothetical protein